MDPSLWTDVNTGARLGRADLEVAQGRARQLYAANPHVFEDEAEALRALGVVPLLELMAEALHVEADPPAPVATTLRRLRRPASTAVA